MPQRNRAPIRIHPPPLPRLHEPQLAQAMHRLARKRLVNLPPIHVLLPQPQPPQQPRDHNRRPDAHLVRIAPRRRRGHKLAHDAMPQPQLRRRAPPHQQRRRRPVRDLARVARGARPVRLKRRLQLRQRLRRHALPNPVVPRDHNLTRLAHGVPLPVHILEPRPHRHNLPIEPAPIPRPRRPHVRLPRNLVLHLPPHAIPLRNVLRRQPHRHHAIPHVLLRCRLVLERRPNVHGNRPAPVVPRHALHARPYPDVHHAVLDLRRHQRNALQGRRARAVRCEERRPRRVARVVQRHARRLGAPQLREHDAHAHVVDERGVQFRDRFAGGLEDHREELFRVGVFELAFVGAADGRPERGQDDRVGGGFGQDGGEPFGHGGWWCCCCRC
ncbi:hypothetical protein CCMA1212_000431 [Trichoderma ghanense]|uniref:Uncharacterized protein n=1 Tax=Trichoderma ghanense TaxID=65468 RepID=A0ABY2HEM9_9HYPO